MSHAASKDRVLIAVIGDEVGSGRLSKEGRDAKEDGADRCVSFDGEQDSITGLLLAGIGHIDKGTKNFLIANESESEAGRKKGETQSRGEGGGLSWSEGA